MRPSSVLIFSTLFAVGVSAGPKSIEEVYAGRSMNSLDHNGNGSYEKSENPGKWEKYRQYDANGDEILTVEELIQAKQIQYLETGTERKLNVLYKQTPEEDLYFDLYYPADMGTGKIPVIFYAHGGGWGAGDKQGAARGDFAVLFKRLLDKGFAVVSINYRLWRKDSTYVPDCVADCKDAMRYAALNSGALQLDPQRFYSFGNSAGGHLSQMMLLTPPDLQLGDPRLADAKYNMVAGVSWFGFTNVEEKELFIKPGRDYKGRDPRLGTITRVLEPGLTDEQKEKVLHEMSPTTYLSKNSPPLFVLHGDKDTAVIVEHAYFIDKIAQERGAPVEVLIVKNAKHGWGSVKDGVMVPPKDEVIDRTVQFFVDHL